MKEVLSGHNIRYGYVEITAGMAQLKKYLKIRDHAASHAEARASGSVGIPTLVVDDESYVIESPEAAEKLIADLGLDAEQKKQ
ncbi:MAG TPA: glutaredoxin [Firmicutes bacterium]|nr:glutaredoxin [Bacillota bacterium]